MPDAHGGFRRMAADNNQLHPFTQMIREGPHFPLAYPFPSFARRTSFHAAAQIVTSPNGTAAPLEQHQAGHFHNSHEHTSHPPSPVYHVSCLFLTLSTPT